MVKNQLSLLKQILQYHIKSAVNSFRQCSKIIVTWNFAILGDFKVLTSHTSLPKFFPKVGVFGQFHAFLDSLSAIIFTDVSKVEMVKFEIFLKLIILYLLYGQVIGFYGFGRISARFGRMAADRCRYGPIGAEF